MTAEIQFVPGKKEPVLPIVKVTKSKSGKTGTATFLFIRPKTIFVPPSKILPINGMELLWNKKKIFTNDVTISFFQGKPFLVKAILIFKNSVEWFEFLYFMTYYSKETGLSFSEKNSFFRE